MSFDEALLDDADALERRDEGRQLWNLATAGAQVRRAIGFGADFAVDRLVGASPRAVLIATDTPPSVASRLLTRVGYDGAPTLAWHGAELPRWAGPADALLIGSLEGRHPRLAELAAQAGRRGLAMAVVAPAGSPLAAAAGRSPLHELPDDLHPHASRWALLAPLLQALDALGVHSAPPLLLGQVADALDAMAETCRLTGELFTNPAKSLAVEFADARPLIVGAGALAEVAALGTADAVQLSAGIPAVAIGLPDGVARAAALMRGSATGGGSDDDFFRDRVDDTPAQRARLLVLGDEGAPTDRPGEQSGGQSLAPESRDEPARRGASALRRLADDLGLRASGIDVGDGPPLARFAAASAFGDFTAAYLALGLGLDPGASRPAELRR